MSAIPCIAQAGIPSNTIVATITLPFAPGTLVCSSDSGYIYGIGTDSSTNVPQICVIDATKNQVVSTFNIGAQYILPDGDLAISQDGKTLYASLSNNTLVLISTATQSVTATLPYAYTLGLSPDGSQLWMNSGNTIEVLDTQDNTLLSQTMTLPGFPNSIAFTPDGAHAYIAYQVPPYRADNLALIDSSSLQVLKSDIDNRFFRKHGLDGATGLVMAPNGKQLYVDVPYHRKANNPLIGVTDVLSLAGGRPQTIDSWAAVGITPDGGYLYAFAYTNSLTTTLASIDTTTNQVVGPTLSVQAFSRLIIRPDGQYAYVFDPLVLKSVAVVNIQPSS